MKRKEKKTKQKREKREEGRKEGRERGRQGGTEARRKKEWKRKENSYYLFPQQKVEKGSTEREILVENKKNH